MAVIEAYTHFVPPFGLSLAVEALLRGVSPKYLSGLRSVVLRDAAGLTGRKKRKKTRSRGRTVPLVKCRGLYYEQTRQRPARIELFVDNIVASRARWLFSIPVFRDMFVARTLYHEIGHHIHRNIVREFREREDVAEEWGRRLSRAYFRQRYWYLIPAAWLLRAVLKSALAILRLAGKRPRSRRSAANPKRTPRVT